MPFFTEAHDFTINNGDFIDVAGHATFNNNSRHTNNVNSNNTTTNVTKDSYNTSSYMDYSTQNTNYGGVREEYNAHSFTQNNSFPTRGRYTEQYTNIGDIRRMTSQERADLDRMLEPVKNLQAQFRIKNSRPPNTAQQCPQTQPRQYIDSQYPIPTMPQQLQYYSSPEVPQLKKHNPFRDMQNSNLPAPVLTHSQSAPLVFDSVYSVEEEEEGTEYTGQEVQDAHEYDGYARR